MKKSHLSLAALALAVATLVVIVGVIFAPRAWEWTLLHLVPVETFEGHYRTGELGTRGGKVRYGQFEGRLHGQYVGWWKNGAKKHAGDYFRGEKTGVWTYWNSGDFIVPAVAVFLIPSES